MDLTLTSLKWKKCLVYLDDVVIFGRTFQEHLNNLAEVLQRIRQAGLKLKTAKCRESGVMANSNQHIRGSHLPWPCELLPLICEIVCEHSKTPAPSHGTRTWSNEAEEAFQRLKRALTTAPILAFSRFDIPFIVDTDASETGIGAVLSQKHDPEGERKTEGKYSTTRKELLSIVYFTKLFRLYLVGQRFTLRTDHGSLTWLRNFKEPGGQVARWLEHLQERGRRPTDSEWRELHKDSRDLVKQWKHLRLTPTGLAVVVTGNPARWVPPNHARPSILEQIHNVIGGGHLGVKKTAEKVRTRYFWPAMEEAQDDDWETRIPQVCFAYNASVHETTGYAPFEIMFGRPPRLPVDAAFNTNMGKEMTTSKYVEELAAHLRNAVAAARKHSAEEQKRQRYYYNRKAGNMNYQTHEADWLYCHVNKGKRNRKFATPWTGPVEIIEQVSGVNYRIRSIGSPDEPSWCTCAIRIRQKYNANKEQERRNSQFNTKPRTYRPRLVWAEEDRGLEGTSTPAVESQMPRRKRNPPVRYNDYILY
ncbi:Transposon Ty3-I Gag-Pol polyprotein [Trichinella spiralis]|uniref:RNA-directed DNA polymerase n=1 Tax=Trichinella spiralis TaxID=6334 RepID=A0A0V1B3U4_TRISP|nr:Transposon Ty3-I Gag-Pol polyprotein [Trichinella spiralis]